MMALAAATGAVVYVTARISGREITIADRCELYSDSANRLNIHI